MSRVAVVMFRCDGCKTTGEPGPTPERWKQSSYLSKKERYPIDWLEVIGRGNDGEVFGVHYCPKCATELERLMQGMTLDETILEGEGTAMKPEDIADPVEVEINKKLSMIRFSSHADGNKVLVGLSNAEKQFGLVTVADLYDLVGGITKFTDHKYGWRREDLNNTSVVSVGDSGEFALTLPAPVHLDSTAKYEVPGILVKHDTEAEGVLEQMREILGLYGRVTLADIQELVSLPTTYRDAFVGWEKDGVDKARFEYKEAEGFQLVVPRPINFKKNGN